MFGIDVGTAILIGLVALAVASALFARKFFSRPEFSDVHNGKDHHGGCKFDADEVRRTLGQFVPPIDTSNVPAADPRVQTRLNAVSVDDVRERLLKLSGEKTATIAGQGVNIKSRSTHSGKSGIDLALAFVEEFYRTNGIAVRRIPYTVRGRNYANLEATIEGLNFKVKILHFTGEEQGLWGSYKYSDMVAADKTDVVGMLQMDMVGYCPDPGHRLDVHDAVDRNGSHSLTETFFRQVKRYGLNIQPFDTHNRAVENRSDHAGFLDHGWKAIMLSEEFSDTGFNPHYHSTRDRVSALNIPYIVEVIKAATAFVLDMSEQAGEGNRERVFYVGSHLDSTAGSTWGSEAVAPGADDDASGTVACTEVALALRDLVKGK